MFGANISLRRFPSSVSLRLPPSPPGKVYLASTYISDRVFAQYILLIFIFYVAISRKSERNYNFTFPGGEGGPHVRVVDEGKRWTYFVRTQRYYKLILMKNRD